MGERKPMLGLKKMRKQLKLTQLRAADILGFTFRTYQNYEGGYREAGYEDLLKLARLFNCHVEDLF